MVVDVDLAKFFDRVNHDILIDRLKRRIDDAGVIRLVTGRGFARGGQGNLRRGRSQRVSRATSCSKLASFKGAFSAIQPL